MSDSSTGSDRALRLPPGLETAALGFTWRGPDAHLAPERATPLSQALLGKTNCALVVLTAANLLWSARRLSSLTDTSPCVFMAETLLCWQSDPLYYDPDGPKQFSPPMPVPRRFRRRSAERQPRSSLSTRPAHFRSAHSDRRKRDLADAFASGRRVRLAVSPMAEGGYCEARRLAPNPVQDFRGRDDFPNDEAYQEFKRKNMGSPLPLQAVNPETETNSAQLSRHYAEFLAQVDFTTNPYLRSPSDMSAAGFVGEPYR